MIMVVYSFLVICVTLFSFSSRQFCLCSDFNNYNYDYMVPRCDAGDNLIELEANATGDANTLYGFVYLTEHNAPYRPNFHCPLTVRAPVGYRVYLRILKIDIYKSSGNSDDSCSPDYLNVTGYNTTYSFCGYGVPPVTLSSYGRDITLLFHSGDWTFSNDRIGFRLYYTAFREGSCNPGSEFSCWRDGRCIPDEVTCDGLDNCGDWSDEAVATCGLSTGAIIAIGVSCAAVVMCFIAFVGYYFYGKKQDKDRNRSGNAVNEGDQAASVWSTTGGVTVTPAVGSAAFSAPTNAQYDNGIEPPPPYTFSNGQMMKKPNYAAVVPFSPNGSGAQSASFAVGPTTTSTAGTHPNEPPPVYTNHVTLAMPGEPTTTTTEMGGAEGPVPLLIDVGGGNTPL